MHIDKSDGIVGKYCDTYSRTIKVKPVYVEASTWSNDKDHKFNVGDHVRISKPNGIFAKTCTPNRSE